MNTELFSSTGNRKPLTLRLTIEQAYRRKQKLWAAHCNHAARVRRAFFPDTGGVSLYLHNWHKCGSDKAKAALAEWIDHSTYARYKRIEARLEARDAEREHLRHCTLTTTDWVVERKGKRTTYTPRTRLFDAAWCPLCPHVH